MAQWIEKLRRRFLIQDFTPLPADPKAIEAAYLGIDPTADSLHVGHLVPLQLLSHIGTYGIHPIIVIGGATARIGDPSGRNVERPLLPEETIQENKKKLAQQVQKIIPFAFTLLDNSEWLGQLSLIDFLRDIGKHITISYLLNKETIQSRLESGLSFTEFSYTLLQAYDFYYLLSHRNCRLQIGGADQWGNITTGIELIRKRLGIEAYGMTCPLLTRADGVKFGKTAEGETIWLDAQKTSPYRFYQFWLNQADAEMRRLMGIFSWKSEEEVEEVLQAHEQAPEQRLAQRTLAYEMTARIHGEEIARTVQQVSEIVFDKGDLKLLEEISESLFQTVVSEMPHYKLNDSRPDLPIGEALVQVGFLRSKSELRQLIRQGGLSVNRHKLQEENLPLYRISPLRGRFWLVQRGKKYLAWLEAASVLSETSP
ncbi:MAG: tyrosine--tRNA ligase [Bacteroidia bacterium]|nr:tyrosine--tRNA ligase [Bacteroidia bacterium]MDW8015993.1 tyrosine--tRNA ligase [Bacteroidia bacterium]